MASKNEKIITLGVIGIWKGRRDEEGKEKEKENT